MLDIRCNSPGVHWVWSKYSPSTLSIAYIGKWCQSSSKLTLAALFERSWNVGCGSGRIEARTGLRMMPTFPRSPLSFRTAGFPQYGWKAGFPSGAFLGDRRLKLLPACAVRRPVCIRPSRASWSQRLSRSVSGHQLDCAPPWRVITCACRKSNPGILMMQSPED